MNSLGAIFFLADSLPDFDFGFFADQQLVETLDWGAYLSVLLLATFKHLWAIAVGLFGFKFSLIELLLTAGLGAIIGAVAFTFFGTAIRQWYYRLRKPKKTMSFARRRRLLVFWKRYGLIGTVAIIPLLSPPVAIAVAVAMNETPRRILTYMIAGILIYTVLLFFASDLLYQLMAAMGRTNFQVERPGL